MIKIGLTTWTEHPSLLLSKPATLWEYASKLPVVEVDNPFYGIPSQESVAKWVSQTPTNFKFLIKGHQAMTLHRPWQETFSSEKELYETYFETIAPILKENKLAAILLQFPARFDCVQEHILYLRRLRKIFGALPVAIEFRHPSWYEPKYLEQTISFMRQEKFILLTIDEPQVLGKSVPFHPVVTNDDQAIFRFHGRSKTGWNASGDNWRKERTLYCYNESELQELAMGIKKVSSQVKETIVIFNNNSGGDAAANALALMDLLEIEYTDLNPTQLGLF